ncbi:hypothetical protein R0K19_21120, partial [Bacillus sp. SIMBA_161]
ANEDKSLGRPCSAAGHPLVSFRLRLTVPPFAALYQAAAHFDNESYACRAARCETFITREIMHRAFDVDGAAGWW